MPRRREHAPARPPRIASLLAGILPAAPLRAAMLRAAMLSAALVPAALGLGSCGRSFEPTPLDATLRPVVERALERAVQDSALYAAGTFTIPAKMHVDMRKEDTKVTIADSFHVSKKPGGDLTTSVIHMDVRGDSTILGEMYSFRAPGTKTRTFEETQVERLNIGADIRKMLRTMLGGTKMAVRLLDEAAVIGGRQCHLLAFESDDGQGKMALARDNGELVRIEVEQSEDFTITGFEYAMSADYHRLAGGPPFPAATRSRFSYRRPFSSGSGTIAVVFDTASTPPARPLP